jgi:hypothetical protein
MILKNTTHLDTAALKRMFLRAIDGWPREGLQVSVRYSRGADFSGTCYYQSDRIYVNLGRDNRYPYRMQTHIARPQSNRTHWWRQLYAVDLGDASELALFIFLHEFYHRLVHRARRNVRQKEARCDRFATRVLVDGYGAAVLDPAGRPVSREAWDFQDLDGFVAAARRAIRQRSRNRLPHPSPAQAARDAFGQQLTLFTDA